MAPKYTQFLEERMRIRKLVVVASIVIGAACSGGNAARPGDSALSPAAEDNPAIMRALDGIPGWTRTSDVETYAKDGLYGYIDGGAEIVLQYGFRELAVFRFKPAAAAAPALPARKELVLEIYRMDSGEAAFGLYSTKLEGEEESWPGIRSDHWVSLGQGGLAKGEYMVNILAPDCTDREIGDFAAALEPKIPGKGTARPKGMDWLPRAGMVLGSWRYIKGPLAAQGESPFLEAAFWGFGATNGATEAYSAKYGVAPAVSKLVIVEFRKAPEAGALDDAVLAVFREYLKDVRREGKTLEGKNEAGRWFLFGQNGRFAALVLGEADRNLARARLDLALDHALGTAGAAPQEKPKMFLVVTFDTEDYITPEAEHIDDIPKWLAEIMTEEGVTGTFFVIGEKGRSLEKRGRRDVIVAMARHDIGSHTNFGSIHPTVTEELEKAGWDDGVRRMQEQESAGIEELERIFGVRVTTLARHGGSYGPQLVYALGRIGAGYQGSPASLPGHDVVWFCNALNFSAQYAGFDDAYYRDDLFEPVFDKLKAELPEQVQTANVLALFAGHPTKIRAEEFWDLNFYNGKNTAPAEWKTPRLRQQETMVTAQKNFRRMLRYLKSRDDIEITTYRALIDVYSRQKEIMTRDEIRAIAIAALEAKVFAPSEDFSPAEAFAGLARAIAGYQKDGALPRSLATIHPLGPMEMPPAQPEIARVKLEDVYGLAREASELIGQTGALPASLSVGGARVGTGSLFALFGAVYLDSDSGKPRPEYDVSAFEPYPRTNEAKIISEVEGYKGWPVHSPDLDMSRIVEFTKLQLWTLKPARRR
jgi:peptidoglycan/xylan/chitin deacetylase (PgdA/CDA1 family)